MFLGPEHCRNLEWLTTTAEYSENLFITGFILRVVPHVLRPFVAPLLPSYRTLLRNVSSGRRVIGDIIRSQHGDSNEDILSWMRDAATGEEKQVDNIAQRMLILSLASIHTTAMTMTHAMYDLCAHPEYIEPLRYEVKGVVDASGWDKTTLNRLHKLDSFLKESQRFNPVFLCKFLLALLICILAQTLSNIQSYLSPIHDTLRRYQSPLGDSHRSSLPRDASRFSSCPRPGPTNQV